MTNIVKAISMKSLGYKAKDIRKLVEDKKESVFLGRITGFAASYFTGESVNGEFVGFRGKFFAVNAQNEIQESGTAFLPAGIAHALREQLDAGVVEVEITADVYAQETDKNASGYAYICEPVLSSQAQDKLNSMRASLTKGLPVAITDQSKKSEKAKKEAA